MPTLAEFGLDALSVAERIEVGQAIWESLPLNARSGLTDSQRQELERRLADHASHPEDLIPWEEIKAAAIARWQS